MYITENLKWNALHEKCVIKLHFTFEWNIPKNKVPKFLKTLQIAPMLVQFKKNEIQ